MNLTHNIRFISAASLFDGHDAAINIMRRILQSEGAEVIHLGHNRSVDEICKAAIEEDVQGIALSSYQGGHVEYFSYLLQKLKENHAENIKIFGGGGGVIIPEEIKHLESIGIAKIFSPEDGLKYGLKGMIRQILELTDTFPAKPVVDLKTTNISFGEIAKTITTFELGDDEKNQDFFLAKQKLKAQLVNHPKKSLIIGLTGTGGAGKSSLLDEIVLRFLDAFPQKKVAILSIDPTNTKTQGALLGDRIRMSTASSERVFMRSMATRNAHSSISSCTKDVSTYLSLCDFDLVFVETSGIGQSDSLINNIADFSIYVMTPEFGAPSQLEKIAMLNYADLVVINKFDRPKSIDALKDVRKTLQRNKELFDKKPQDMPVFASNASVFNDLGVNKLFNNLITLINKKTEKKWVFSPLQEGDASVFSLIPYKRQRYLAEVAHAVEAHHSFFNEQANLTKAKESLNTTIEMVKNDPLTKTKLDEKLKEIEKKIAPTLKEQLKNFYQEKAQLISEKSSYKVRENLIEVENYTTSLSGLKIPKVSVPLLESEAEIVKFLGKENFPGKFPFTAGVFPFKRSNEDPTRMFAGEGLAEKTNKRFHFLSLNQNAKRLSTAFDSVTLYGQNPDLRPDIFGKIGNAGVSVCCLDDAKRLYSGFDLCAPNVSVSLTINGPSPTIMAFFFNAAIDFACEKELKSKGLWEETKKKIDAWFKNNNLEKPTYRMNNLPIGHDGSGLGFLGLPASEIVDADFYEAIKAKTLKQVRGTVQADILKEDQAQNTCIFSTEFSLKMMGDMQEYFIDRGIENFYSVSISGYHIAEAGANPITQLAFTLANGFTLLEYYLAKGMKLDDFVKNFSFFFSNGLDPEYAVIGRVARRIWAIALKNIYGANERSQKLKYHIQTSGRSLHAKEMSFNDIRTTLQALYALADNCNSLHTNAFDEAITTPTQESLRRALAIQLIINHELGLTKNENPLQGSFFISQLTDMVESAVLKMFLKLDERGGVLGAMETMYQRSKIQEESMYYEHEKQTGSLPIIGVNTFVDEEQKEEDEVNLRRSSEEEKYLAVKQVDDLKKMFKEKKSKSLASLKNAVLKKENIFSYLLEASKYATLGEITQVFMQVGGSYRRAM